MRKSPSVTRLQRRSKRLHPTSQPPRAGDGEAQEGIPAPVVVLPVGMAGNDLEPVLDIGGGSAGDESVDAPVEEHSEWNRRLGMLALSGAAAVSALVLALALGGGRVNVSVIRGGGRFPVGVPGFVQGRSPDKASSVRSGRGPSEAGTTRARTTSPPDPTRVARSERTAASVAISPPGDRRRPENPAPADDPGPPDDGRRGGGGGDGGGGGGSGGGGGGGGGGGNGGGGGGGGGVAAATEEAAAAAASTRTLPGHSAEHNPHGGPPGHMGDTPAHGPGLGVGSSADHSSHGHAHKH